MYRTYIIYNKRNNNIVNRFPVGFEGRPSLHRRLVSMLHREFGRLILEPDRGAEGLGPTLNDIWNSGKRLIICYGDKHTVNGAKTTVPFLQRFLIIAKVQINIKIIKLIYQ